MYINYEEIVNKQIKRDIQFELESAYNGLNILENKIKNNNIQNCTYKNIANTKIKIKERVKELG